MNVRTFNTLGGFQSMLFCIGIYLVSLVFSIFICSALFKAFSGHKAGTAQVTSTTAGSRSLVASR